MNIKVTNVQPLIPKKLISCGGQCNFTYFYSLCSRHIAAHCLSALTHICCFCSKGWNLEWVVTTFNFKFTICKDFKVCQSGQSFFDYAALVLVCGMQNGEEWIGNFCRYSVSCYTRVKAEKRRLSFPWHLNGAFIFPKDAIADICTQPWSSNIAICSEDQHDFRIFPLLSSLAFPVGSLGSAQIQFNLNQQTYLQTHSHRQWGPATVNGKCPRAETFAGSTWV